MAEQITSSGYYQNHYKFNGKELDNETGMYYYGARYYEPRLSVWMSVDPKVEEYAYLSPYVYCANNPIIFIDPDGNKAWPVIRQWNRADIANFAAYSQNKIHEFIKNGEKDNCADFAVRLIVGYAAENGLPLTLQNRGGKTFDASSEDYANTKQYLNAAKAGIQAADLPSNSYRVTPSETQSGDFQVIQYTKYKDKPVDFQHTAIFENSKVLVYGNLPPAELKRINSKYWSNGSHNASQNWYIVTGDQNSRWNVLNPNTMPREAPMEYLKPKPIPLLTVKPNQE